MNAGPKNSRGKFIGKPAQAGNFNLERRPAIEGCKLLLKIVETGGRPFTNELGCDMQVIERTPLDHGFWPQCCHQAIKPKEHVRREFDGREESHRTRVLTFSVPWI